MTSSGLSQVWFGYIKFLSKSLCVKLGDLKGAVFCSVSPYSASAVSIMTIFQYDSCESNTKVMEYTLRDMMCYFSALKCLENKTHVLYFVELCRYIAPDVSPKWLKPEKPTFFSVSNISKSVGHLSLWLLGKHQMINQGAGLRSAQCD